MDRVLSRHGKSFAAFAVVGGLTAAIYFGVFWLLNDALHQDYRVAVSVAYFAGVAFHFTVNRNVTFRSQEGRLHSQLAKYAVVAFVNYLVTLAVVQVCVTALNLSPYVGVLAAVAATLVSGYLLFRFWVFRPHGTGT